MHCMVRFSAFSFLSHVIRAFYRVTFSVWFGAMRRLKGEFHQSIKHTSTWFRYKVIQAGMVQNASFWRNKNSELFTVEVTTARCINPLKAMA